MLISDVGQRKNSVSFVRSLHYGSVLFSTVLITGFFTLHPICFSRVVCMEQSFPHVCFKKLLSILLKIRKRGASSETEGNNEIGVYSLVLGRFPNVKMGESGRDALTFRSSPC